MPRLTTPLPVVLMLLVLGACGRGDAGEPRADGTRPRLFEVAPEDANLVLHLSNQSAVLPQVDVEVWIDGRPALEDLLDVGEGASFQHVRETYHFRLDPGPHEIRALSRLGEALLEEVFRIGDAPKHWASLTFWYGPAETPAALEEARHLVFALARAPTKME